MRKILFKIVMLAGITVALTACYPGGAEYTSDTDIVLTNYDEEYNFNSIQTYYLDDDIYHIVEDTNNINRTLDPFIIGELARNFDNMGWVRLDSTNGGGEEPDVAVVVTIIKVTNYNVYYNPWYWGWGGGWYWKSTGETTYWGYPGYGWGYPYYGGSYMTSYEVGTIFWDLFDPDNVDEENETINISWTGAVNGVVGTSTTTTKSRITTGIDQAFRQSAYLSE